jgi:hypothetical protein
MSTKTLDIQKALQNSDSPSESNPFVTASQLAGSNELSEVLANGNDTGGTNISVTTGDAIVGAAELTLTGTTSATLGAATTLGLTGGTGLTATATTGDLALVSTAGEVNATAGTSIGLTATTTVGITGGTGVTLTATTGNANFISTAAEIFITAATNATIEATTGFAYLYAPAGIAYVEGNGGFDLRSSGVGTTGVIIAPTLDVTIDDLNIVAADAIAITGVSTTINTRETIWTSQAAAAIALVDSFKLYSADIIAGNAAPHFETEVGDIIKLYSNTTAIAASAFVANTSLIADDTATFGGFTIGQMQAAMLANGLLK